MSELYRAAFADPHYGLIMKPALGYVLAAGPGTPTALALPAAGYAPGCVYVDTTNANVYRNTGSVTAATWVLMVGAGDTVASLIVTALTATTITATSMTLTNALALAAGSTAGGQFIGANAPVAVLAATTTLTLTAALHAGKIVTFVSTGGLAITPPAATGTGNTYELVAAATISGGNVTIDAKAGNASDVFGGVAIDGSSGGTSATFGTASNSNLITLNGTTTGGLKGTCIIMTDVATNVWSVQVANVCSGTAATVFSNH